MFEPITEQNVDQSDNAPCPVCGGNDYEWEDEYLGSSAKERSMLFQLLHTYKLVEVRHCLKCHNLQYFWAEDSEALQIKNRRTFLWYIVIFIVIIAYIAFLFRY